MSRLSKQMSTLVSTLHSVESELEEEFGRISGVVDDIQQSFFAIVGESEKRRPGLDSHPTPRMPHIPAGAALTASVHCLTDSVRRPLGELLSVVDRVFEHAVGEIRELQADVGAMSGATKGSRRSTASAA